MRSWIVAFVVLAACKGGKHEQEPPVAAKPAIAVPKVEVATVLGTIEDPPPFLVILDEHGTLRIDAVASWNDLATKDLEAGAKSADLDTIDRRTRDAFAMRPSPLETLAHWDEMQKIEDDFAKLERAPSTLDDPPPPEEEVLPEEEDESGGTVMVLEDGVKRHPNDRVEGQDEVAKHAEDPVVARRRQMGKRGPLHGFAKHRDTPNADGTPRRVADVAGEVIESGKLERPRTVIFVPSTAKATKLIELVARLEGSIVVSQADALRPLRVSFANARDPVGSPTYWLEARVSAKGLAVEAVPDPPIELASLDGKALAVALDKARTARGAQPLAPVDVLVDPDVDAQRLVDVIVALDTAGVRMIGLGAMPSAEELQRRGKHIPTVTPGRAVAQGDLDKQVIRRVVREHRAKIVSCYVTALLAKPGLAGTVMVQFFIAPTGKVTSASAHGVALEVASCVGEVIEQLEFPPPKGGGGVQVNYPFTMRP